MMLLIGGEKGGTGKTTLSTNLAAFRAATGKDVLLVDTDPQGSASYWCGTRDEAGIAPRISSIHKFGKGFQTQLVDLSRRFDDIIIDAGGRDSLELREALAIVSVVVIPLQASQYDVWTLSRMSELVERAKSFNPGLNAYIVLNRASTNPMVKEVAEARQALEDFGNLTLLDTLVRDRIVFRKSASRGASVAELDFADNSAITEIQNLYSEVFRNAD